MLNKDNITKLIQSIQKAEKFDLTEGATGIYGHIEKLHRPRRTNEDLIAFVSSFLGSNRMISNILMLELFSPLPISEIGKVSVISALEELRDEERVRCYNK